MVKGNLELLAKENKENGNRKILFKQTECLVFNE